MDGFVTPLDRLSEICWRLGYVADRDLAAHDIQELDFRKEEDSLIVTIANHIFEA